MKIILTVHQFLPEFSTGTEVIALGIARELRERDHQVTIVTGYPDPRRLDDTARFDSYRHEGFRVERFRHAARPMGDQRVVTELGYDNRLFAQGFRRLLAEIQPDLVHFVHLSRLSASLIGPCVERGLPTVFTATDFWAVCPFSQLRLPDNSLCPGPDTSGLNCVRHSIQHVGARRPSLARLAQQSPDWLLGLGMRAANRPLPFAPRLVGEMRALTQRQPYLRRELNRLNRVLVPARLMERILVQGGIDPELIRFLPYGIATERIARSTRRGDGPVLRLGFLGSVSEHKGVEVAIAAIRLLDPALSVELSIHGAAGLSPEAQAYYGRLESLVREDRRIRLCGPYDHARVGEVLSSLDVLVVPSIWRENTPLVVYESFAAGCPVIASDVEGVSEVVRHEIDGLLFERGDPAALASCIRRVAEDRALLAGLAERTRMPLSVSEHVTELERVYAQLLGERPENGGDGTRRVASCVESTGPHNRDEMPLKPNHLREGQSVRIQRSRSTRSRPLVQVLLSTYNGEAFLRPLLRSLDEQTYPELDLLVRDDGSTDGTIGLLRSHLGRVPTNLLVGSHLGLPTTFFQLLRESRTDAELFAFCDQDDVWLPGKIERAVGMLEAADARGALLYCGRTRYVDAELRPLGLSDLPCHPPSFQSALFRNIASGCTIVMNRAARELLLDVVPPSGEMHDAWAYLVVSAFGTVLYDPVPMLEYRQHRDNTIGRPRSLPGRLVKLFQRGCTWPYLRRAHDFHRYYGDRLGEEDRRALEHLLQSRESIRSRVRYALSADRQRCRLRDDLAFRLLFIAGRM